MTPCSFTRLAAALACTFATTASFAAEPMGHVGDWCHTVRYEVQGTSTDLTARGHAVSLAGRISAPVIAGLIVHGDLGVARCRVRRSTPAEQPALAIDGSGTGGTGTPTIRVCRRSPLPSTVLPCTC